MKIKKLLIANRGEIAVRIAQAAGELGISTVSVFSSDDEDALHTARTTQAIKIAGVGPGAYLDIDQIIKAALETRAEAIHPGYGFLSENPDFAQACADAGILFVGPTPDQLRIFGDKVTARSHAIACGVEVLPGTKGDAGADEIRTFLASNPNGIVIKAIAGGGGRGMRFVRDPKDIEENFKSASAEAQAAFGDGALFAERLVNRARHIEIQVIGDGRGSVLALGERECSLQRRSQKLIEIAPSPQLNDLCREQMISAAMRLAESCSYRSLGTFEFLIEESGGSAWFIEANPRLQVEHTVTEQVWGVDLVMAQLKIAQGASLAELGYSNLRPHGTAIQLRVNTEVIQRDGSAKPTSGTLNTFDIPFGPGIRVDSGGYAGYQTNPRFDSLLAKVIVHRQTFPEAVVAASRSLASFKITGVETNIGFLRNLLNRKEMLFNQVHTRFIEEYSGELVEAENSKTLYHATTTSNRDVSRSREDCDTLVEDDQSAVRSPMAGTVAEIRVDIGAEVRPGQTVAIVDAMKMQHDVTSEHGGYVDSILVTAADMVSEGQVLLVLRVAEIGAQNQSAATVQMSSRERRDLVELLERRALLSDAARKEAVERRHESGRTTARENIEMLIAPESWIEYGSFAIASQRTRRPVDDLIRNTPADGCITGVGKVNAEHFSGERSRVGIVHFDTTVLAGTQGRRAHKKLDRIFTLAEEEKLPIIIFTEGAGGRPGEVDVPSVHGLTGETYLRYGRLSGLVPLVAVNTGYCFAGNAGLLGCSDVVIATKQSNIGMGGPAMIEGGGLGTYSPQQIGPTDVQAPNGVIDILVDSDGDAISAAKKYLSYFQGPMSVWTFGDQLELRESVPEHRQKVFSVRSIIRTMCDTDSVLELREKFAPGMITALARVEGKSLGIIANNSRVLGGAITSDGADKAARFMQLCDAFEIPIVNLCDTPGMMVGPAVEMTALVRHCCRLYVTGANLSVPSGTIVLRKAYGLGAIGMASASFLAPRFTVSWPTGEFGSMNIEGMVKLGFKKELANIDDPAERNVAYQAMVQKAYENGKALNTATYFEVDEVIDPAESRQWISTMLLNGRSGEAHRGKKHPFIDTW